LREVSKNNTRPCFALKCDVRKFFDSIDHKILLEILAKRIIDTDTLWLLEEVINSYPRQIRERERERVRRSAPPIRACLSAISPVKFLPTFT
jgi:retron-type reverse transcriptase